MFSTSKKNVYQDDANTIIGESTTIEGNIASDESIRVEGDLTGNIDCKSDVTIGELGHVTGNINGSNVSVSGKVEGNIESSALTKVTETGKVLGDIETINLVVEDGGIVNGNCAMKVNDVKRIIGPIEE